MTKTMNIANRELSRFSASIWIVIAAFLVFACSFIVYVRAEKAIDRANELRMEALRLGAELRQSSEDLTNMARSYVVTGDPVYRNLYREILEIRDGRRQPRPSYATVYWERGQNAGSADAAPEAPRPLTERFRLAGLSEGELLRLEAAKARSDALAQVESRAMEQVDAPGGPDGSERLAAIGTLHDVAYFDAKAEIMRGIAEFNALADERMSQSVREAEQHATWFRLSFIALGLVLLALLWNVWRTLRAVLGGSVVDVHDSIARLGSGNFSAPRAGSQREGSVLAWLAETQRKLAAIDGERRRAEAERERLLSEQQAMLENEVIGIFKTRDRRITWANPAIEKMFGYRIGESVGMDTRFFYPDEDMYVAVGAQAYDALENGRSFRVQVPLRRRDGRELWVDVSGAVLDRANGETIWCMLDVTEERRAQREQHRLNRALRLLGDCNLALFRAQAEDALFADICRLVVHSGGYLMAWIGLAEHDAARSVRPVAVFGKDEGYVAGVRVSWDAGSELGRGPIGRAIRSGTTQINQDYSNNSMMTPWREAALARGYRSSIGLVLTCGQQAIGVLSIYASEADAFNADEVRLLEELARNMSYGIETLRTRVRSEAAEAASIAKSSFLANMSHEIRTPMNAIIGTVHLMRRDGGSPRQLVQLDRIGAASEHLLNIINDILDLSKIEAGKLTLADEDVSIDALFENLGSILSPRASAKGLKLVVHCEGIPDRLRGDRTRLLQALLNYANNAVKFTEQGMISIGVRVIEETVTGVLLRFEVQDTGKGLAPEACERVFGAFEQADNSTTREYGGTGLGLAITRHLAQLMGGETGVASVLGQGSTFWFTCRLARASGKESVARPEANGSSEQDIAQRHEGRCVLLVEDDLVNREVALELLSGTRLKIDVAGDGVEAVRKASESHYDLILMDMQMPRMGGIEATRQIRQLPGGDVVPIVAMTANAFVEDKAQCIAAGMSDFLSKPVEPAMLYDAILRWLPKQQVASSFVSRSALLPDDPDPGVAPP